MKNYEKFLSTFTKSGSKVTDLSRAAALMAAVGNPQNSLKFVHIAGTNGKGSTAEMIARALTHAGYKAGLFTSPYIIRYNDRIRINGREIPDNKLEELFDTAEKPAVEGLPEMGFSQFEITQAAAMLWFLEEKCDIIVLEAGLGGLLDSTNIIKNPLVSIITSVSFDHTAILGNTIESIATQKAGIIKENRPCILSCGNRSEVVEIVKKTAESKHSRLIIPDSSDCYILKTDIGGINGNEFLYDGRHLKTAMAGEKQIDNAMTAVECLKLLKSEGFERIEKSDIDFGLAAVIPARIQVVSREPLVILDGGHNPDGIAALASLLDTLDCKKKILIGMMKNKDCKAAAEIIAHCGEEFYCTDVFSPDALPAEDLAGLLKANGVPTHPTHESISETVKTLKSNLKENEALVICGSLYLASAVMEK